MYSLFARGWCVIMFWVALPPMYSCFLVHKSLQVRVIPYYDHWTLCSLGGCAAWSADACTFLILFRTFSCVYTYVMSTWSMPWAGTLSRIWRNSPRGWLVPMFMWVGFIHCPCPVGWPDSVLFTFYLVFLSCLTVSPYRCFYLHILFDGYPCNKRGVVSESVLRSRHSLKLN